MVSDDQQSKCRSTYGIQGPYLKPDIKQICKLINNVTCLDTFVQKVAIFRKRYLNCIYC